MPDNIDFELQGAGGPILITDTDKRTFTFKVGAVVSMDDTTELVELGDSNGNDLLIAHAEHGPYNVLATAIPKGTIFKAPQGEWYTTCDLGAGIVACYLLLEKGQPVRI